LNDVPPVIVDVPWNDPRAIELRDRMDAEMSVRYGIDGTEDPAISAERSRVLALTGDTVVATVLALDENGAAIGHAALRTRGDALEIKKVVVDPAARGRGVGIAVMAAIEERARRAGASRVILQTGAAQPEAIALYGKLGFTPIPVYEPYRATMPNSLCFEKLLG
jgi:GNAT superfamily N-acetyltransferase